MLSNGCDDGGECCEWKKLTTTSIYDHEDRSLPYENLNEASLEMAIMMCVCWDCVRSMEVVNTFVE